MPKVTVLPHETLCPEGLVFEAATGENLARALLAHGVKIEHACEFSCAAWGASVLSRLSCQTKVGEGDITVEIPKYSRNHAREE